MWLAFVDELSALEARRQGHAKLASISPGELSITIRSLDSAGHMGVEGILGLRTFEAKASITFSGLAFDPSTLPWLVAQARAIGARAT